MNIKLLLLLSVLSLANFVCGQVGINTTTPNASSALDIVSNNKGVLIPRMTTAQKEAIAIPAAGLMVYDTQKKCLSQNVGSQTSPTWICLTQNETRFFYMPSVAIDASALVTGKKLELYGEYKAQFGTPDAKSTSAPGSIPYFPNATDLYYYVTYYDPTVLKITQINDSGTLLYDVIKVADYQSFMNVVFIVK